MSVLRARTTLVKTSSVQNPIAPIVVPPDIYAPYTPPVVDTNPPPPPICTVNQACLESFYRLLFSAGIISSPAIPIGHSVVLNDGWVWQYAGGTTWNKIDYYVGFDLRNDPTFSCDAGAGC